jgi:GNAT superfamily N-acetyltransferase
MRSPDSLRPARDPGLVVTMTLESPCDPGLYRQVYLSVGGDYHWTDRAAWTDADIASHVNRPDIDVWTARVAGGLAGFFELRQVPADDSMEIAYFGLLPAHTGRGLGGHLLTIAVRTAWALGASRVWVHTCTLDHPAALPNYLRRGFVATKVEEYEVGTR